jgi:methionine sulfoxide reductase heme-binding subunit
MARIGRMLRLVGAENLASALGTKEFSPLLAVHIVSWLPLAWLLFDYFTGNLTVNPIQAATIRTGKYALIWLLLSLACTPLNSLLGWRWALKLRRPLGLYAFMYAAVHVFIFAAIDYAFTWGLLITEVALKPYIIVGLTAFTILSLLALTSFRWWVKRLGKNWKRLHRLVYLAAVLVIVHYAWAAKGDVLQLSGDTIQPFAFGLAVALLLLVRVPFIRHGVKRLRSRLSGQIPPSPLARHKKVRYNSKSEEQIVEG